MLDDAVRLLHEIKGVSLARADTARRAAMALQALAADSKPASVDPASGRYLAEEELEAVRHLLQLITETRNEAVALTIAEAVESLHRGLPVPLDPSPAFRGFLEIDELDAVRHLLRLLTQAIDESVALTLARALAVLRDGLPVPLNPGGPFLRLLEEEELAAVRHLLDLLHQRTGASASVALDALASLADTMPVPLNLSPTERNRLCAELDRTLRRLSVSSPAAAADTPAEAAVVKVERIRQVCLASAS